MKHKLLAIEHDEFDRNVIRGVFSGAYSLYLARDMHEASALARFFVPDAVVYTIPVCDDAAMEQLEFLRRGRGIEIPVIVIVPENTIEFERAVRQRGVFYYLVKPYDLRELVGAVRSACGVSNGPRHAMARGECE
jgi:DNA-binding response OmpR family regulator